MWLFLASLTMFFGSLFSAYVLLRAGSTAWPEPFSIYPWLETALLLGAGAAFGDTRIRLIGSNALGLAFVAVRILNDAMLIRRGLPPSASIQLACWFTLGGVHAVHVFAGAVFTGWMASPAFPLREGYEGQVDIKAADRDRWRARIDATRRYWIFMAIVWLAVVGGFYVF